MSEVKRYDCGTEYDGGVMNNSPTGDYVEFDDYAALKEQFDFKQNLTEQVVALEQQRDALAAENAMLKDINAWCQTEAFHNMYREFKKAEAIGCPDVDCMHDAMLTAIMHAPKTPATDAYLNSVRAEGVDYVADHLDALQRNMMISSNSLREYAVMFRDGELVAQLGAGEPS